MQDLKIPHHVIEAVLNHAIPGVAGVYLRSELEEPKAEALKNMGGRDREHCRRLTESEDGEMIPLTVHNMQPFLVISALQKFIRRGMEREAM